MASAGIKFVVSFSSQDEVHNVQNLINGTGCQKWLSNSKDKTGHIEAIFQLEDFLNIAFIDVGTIWCSTIEIQVGRSDWPQDKQYLTLCPTASIMTPIDCRLKQNINKTRMFSTEEFIDTVFREKWDRIKLILRQPYRKDVQFGLSFIKIKSAVVVNNEKPKSWLSPLDDNGRVKMIKSHFFGSSRDREPEERMLKEKLLKLSSTGENGSSELTRTAKLVLAASESTNKTYSPSNRSKENNTIARRGLFSEANAQKSAPKLEDEIVKFLFDQKLTPKDLDIITVADLRHKLEKIKKRKLNSEEKKIFMNYCQSYLVEILDGSIVSDENTRSRSSSHKQQSGDSSLGSSRTSSSNVSDQNLSNTHSRNSLKTQKKSSNKLNIDFKDSTNDRNGIDISKGNVDSSNFNVSKIKNSSSAKFQKSSNNKSTENESIEQLLSENSRLLKSVSKSSESAVTNVGSENINYGDFDLIFDSDAENDLEEISGSNSELSTSNSAKKKSLKTLYQGCIKSQIKNCVDASSSKKIVTINQIKGVTPTRSNISSMNTPLRNNKTINRPLKNGNDIEIVDNLSYKSNMSTPKSSVLSKVTHSDSKIMRSKIHATPISDNFPSTSKTPSSVRKRKRSDSDIYDFGGQTFVGSEKKGRGRGRARANSRGQNDTDCEITDSGSKKGRGRGRAQANSRGQNDSDCEITGSGSNKGRGRGRAAASSNGQNDTDCEITDSGSKKGRGSGRGKSRGRGRRRKSSEDSPIILTDDVWLNIGGGQILGSTPNRNESAGIEESVCRLLPCSICNVKVKDYLLDHHFIQCTARVNSTQIEIPPLPDILGARNTSRGRKNTSKSHSLETRQSIYSHTALSDVYQNNSDSRANGASDNEHNSSGTNNLRSQRDSDSLNQDQNSYIVPEDVLVSDSEDDLELLIPTLQDVVVQCPICLEMFPSEIINVHTNACLDQGS